MSSNDLVFVPGCKHKRVTSRKYIERASTPGTAALGPNGILWWPAEENEGELEYRVPVSPFRLNIPVANPNVHLSSMASRKPPASKSVWTLSAFDQTMPEWLYPRKTSGVLFNSSGESVFKGKPNFYDSGHGMLLKVRGEPEAARHDEELYTIPMRPRQTGVDVMFMDYEEQDRLLEEEWRATHPGASVDDGPDREDIAHMPTPVATLWGPMFAESIDSVLDFNHGFGTMNMVCLSDAPRVMRALITSEVHPKTLERELVSVRLTGRLDGKDFFDITLWRELPEGLPEPVPSGFTTAEIVEKQRQLAPRLCPLWDGA